MLSLRQVSLDVARYRWYGARNWSSLLQDISFDVAPGQMVALVGEVGKVKACCCNVCLISYRTICASTAPSPRGENAGQ